MASSREIAPVYPEQDQQCSDAHHQGYDPRSRTASVIDPTEPLARQFNNGRTNDKTW